MARRRTLLRNVAEYVAARAVIGITRLLPRRAIAGVSRILGRILHRALKGRRRVVYENVALAYRGQPDAPDPAQLSRASFGNLCRSFLELFHVPPADRPKMMVDCIHVAGGITLADVRARARGPVIYTVAHYGAWEISGAASQFLGDPVTSLMRPLDNPFLDKFLNRIRMRFGQRLASNRGGLRDLFAELERGRSVAVLVDLNMKRHGAVFVDYFGVPAATAKTAAVLALRSGRPLVPVFAHRLEQPYRFEVEVGEPVMPDAGADRNAETHRLLSAVTRAVEERVRRRPDQWLWTHRRWKTRPDSANLSEAPAR